MIRTDIKRVQPQHSRWQNKIYKRSLCFSSFSCIGCFDFCSMRILKHPTCNRWTSTTNSMRNWVVKTSITKTHKVTHEVTFLLVIALSHSTYLKQGKLLSSLFILKLIVSVDKALLITKFSSIHQIKSIFYDMPISQGLYPHYMNYIFLILK